jgi:hypothetical protein
LSFPTPVSDLLHAAGCGKEKGDSNGIAFFASGANSA